MNTDTDSDSRPPFAICDKCHKEVAAVYIHIVDDCGGQRDLHYCIPCAIKELQQEDLPDDLKEYLEGIMKIYRDLPHLLPHGMDHLNGGETPPSPIDNQKNPDDASDELSTKNINNAQDWFRLCFDKLMNRMDMDRDVNLELRHNFERHGIDLNGILGKPEAGRCPICQALDLDHEEHCGFCLSFRESDFLNEVVQNKKKSNTSASSKTEDKKTRAVETKCGKETRRLSKLLDRYLDAILNKRVNAAQMLKDEIQGIRQMLKEEMCQLPAVGSTAVVRKGLLPFRGLPPYPALPPESLFLAGCLAQNALDTPQVIQGFQVQANRTAVDFLQSPNMSATEVRNALSALLAKDPLFEDGTREDRTAALFSANGRAMAYIGTQDTIAPRTDGAFSLLFRGTEDEAPTLLRTLGDTLRRLSTRIPFFVTHFLGYYHPMPHQLGGATTLSLALHLPALIRTQGLKGIWDVLPALDDFEKKSQEASLRLTPITPNGAGGLAPCGMLLLQDTRLSNPNLEKRLTHLRKVAHALERAELRARKWMLHSPDFRENALEGFRRAWGIFENGRQTHPEEAFCLLDTLLFGKELGCFPSLNKQRLLDALRLTLCRCTNPAATLRVDTTPLTEEIVWNYARQNRTLPPQENMPDLLWEEQCRGALSLERPESVRPTPQMPESPDDQDQHVFPNPTPAQDFRGEGPARERAQQASLYRHNLMADLQRLLEIPKQGKG
jgi:hypothetical protein